MCQCQAASWWQGSPQKKPYCAWTYMRMHSYPELRNLDDPKKDFLAKQYPSKQLFLGIPPLPHLFFYSRKEIFGWVAKHSQNKQASLLWHVELICFLPSSSLLWDLIARLKFQAPCGHTQYPQELNLTLWSLKLQILCEILKHCLEFSYLMAMEYIYFKKYIVS